MALWVFHTSVGVTTRPHGSSRWSVPSRPSRPVDAQLQFTLLRIVAPVQLADGGRPTEFVPSSVRVQRQILIRSKVIISLDNSAVDSHRRPSVVWFVTAL